MKLKNVFNIKMLVQTFLAALGVGAVAWIMGIIINILNGVGSWAGVVTTLVAISLLAFVVKMHPGKEDFISILSFALTIFLVFGILELFGIALFAPIFEIGTFIGWAFAIITLLFGKVVGMKIAKLINMG